MKKFLLAVVVVFLIAIASPAQAQFSPLGLIEALGRGMPPVVSEEFPATAESNTISIFSVGDKFGLCSGVIIEERTDTTIVLTAKHCIDTFEEMYVQTNLVTLIVASANDDLAYLVVEGKVKGKTPVKIADYPVINGSRVFHVGYPGENLYKSEGKVTRSTKDWQWAGMQSIPGCSGGPVFNDRGELVGILWGGLSDGDTIFEPLDDVKEFLKHIEAL